VARALDPSRQVSQYVHDVWTTNAGLPQDSVNAIAQTPDGYLWIGTQEGLARFDGLSFTNFDASSGILENFVYTLFVDRRGTLWFGASGGLVRYDGHGRFTRWVEKDGWPATAARHITADTRGKLWIGMGNDGTSGPKGMLRFGSNIERIFRTADGLSSDVVSDMAFDRSGRLWIATSKGLDVMTDGRVVRTYTTADGLPGDIVRVLLFDRAGSLWVGTDAGLSVMRGERFERVTNDLVLSMLEDRDGVLWVGTDRGLSRIVDGRLEPARLPGVTGHPVNALFEDREGSLWIGARASGLHRLRTAKFAAIGTPEGLAGDNVNGIYLDRLGRIWLGASPGGVTVIERGRISPVPGLAATARSFREDPDGTMWIGSREGLHRVRGKDVRTWTAADGLPDPTVLSTGLAPDGALWIGTARGVARHENDRIVTVPTPKDFPTTVRVIHVDRSGRLWFAGGEGLAWWDGKRFHIDERFAEAHVMTVYEDTDGTLWFGTWGQGIHRLRNGRVDRFTRADGLFDDVAWSIVDDGRGYLWMGSNRGLFRAAKADFDRRAIACTVYGTTDGMRRRETNWGNPPAIRARDGRLWFGTTGGLVVADPARIRRNPIPPPVIVQRFVADDEEAPLDAAPVLPPGTRNVEIHYAGLSLVSPERVRYRYRLEGYDDRWTDAGTRRTAYYTHIDPGSYRFRVIAANEDGVWNETGATIAFRLEPYFHQTGWFIALSVAALLVSGFALNALGERHRRMRHEAFHDALTALPNRRALDRRASEVLKRAGNGGDACAILFLDLDGFKRINDSLGHASGDEVLQVIAGRLRACIRDDHTLARIGGDEFAVFIASLGDRRVAAGLADLIIASLRQPFAIDGQEHHVGVSIGIAIHPYDGADVKTLLRAADRAMYSAKTAGGNAFRFHS
jgi:diguanylate cyclase (GGDEF)-like protein